MIPVDHGNLYMQPDPLHECLVFCVPNLGAIFAEDQTVEVDVAYSRTNTYLLYDETSYARGAVGSAGLGDGW